MKHLCVHPCGWRDTNSSKRQPEIHFLFYLLLTLFSVQYRLSTAKRNKDIGVQGVQQYDSKGQNWCDSLCLLTPLMYSDSLRQQVQVQIQK